MIRQDILDLFRLRPGSASQRKTPAAWKASGRRCGSLFRVGDCPLNGLAHLHRKRSSKEGYRQARRVLAASVSRLGACCQQSSGLHNR
jgi:hypothetical protein